MTEFIEQIRWTPGIGDASFMGWFTVLAYLGCAIYALQVFRQADEIFSVPVARQKLLWLALAVMMLLLGLNKQLDLQSLLTDIARILSKEQGWYSERRAFQKMFILGIVAVGSVAIVALFFVYFRVIKQHMIAIVGLGLLMIFIVVRATSFHHFDYFLKSDFLGLRFNWLLELSGIGLVAWNAKQLLIRDADGSAS